MPSLLEHKFPSLPREPSHHQLQAQSLPSTLAKPLVTPKAPASPPSPPPETGTQKMRKGRSDKKSWESKTEVGGEGTGLSPWGS